MNESIKKRDTAIRVYEETGVIIDSHFSAQCQHLIQNLNLARRNVKSLTTTESMHGMLNAKFGL